MKFFNLLLSILLLNTITIFAQKNNTIEFKQILDKTKSFTSSSANRQAIERGNAGCLPDSTVTYISNPDNPSDSIVGEKALFTYDAHGNNTSMKNYQTNQNTNILELTASNTYTYDALNRQTSWENYAVNQGTGLLEFNSREVYYPRGTSKLLDSTYTFSLDQNTGAVVQSGKTIFKYNGSNNLEKETVYFWNDSSTPPRWELSQKTEYMYNAQNQIITTSIFNWDGLQWLGNSRSNYSYGSNDSLSTIITTDLATNQLTDKFEILYNLPANSSTFNIYTYDIDSLAWLPFGYVVTDLDAINQIESQQIWISIFGLIIGERKDYNYNSTDCISFTNNYLPIDEATWAYTGRTFYYYGVVATETPSKTAESWSFTPNPASNYLLVNTNNGNNIKLMDMTGKTLRTKTATDTQTRIALNNIPSGHYMLSVQDGAKVSAKIVEVK